MNKSVIKKIEKTVKDAMSGEYPFYYDTPQTLNQRLDNAAYPCVMLHILESNALVDTNGIFRERLSIEMLFANTMQLDFDGIDTEEQKMQALKEAGFAWLVMLYRSHELRLIAINGTHRYYASDDSIIGAYGISVTLEEVQGFAKCNIKPTT